MKLLALVSGGLDSVTGAYFTANVGDLVEVISFDYNQRHRKELFAARKAAEDLAVPWRLVDLKDLPIASSFSALTKGGAVPEGHYAEESMKQTVVPNRNSILISIATGYAVDKGYDGVVISVHGGDHFIYPDCRPEYVYAIASAMRIANVGFASPLFHIDAPFLYKTKAEIVTIGDALMVPFGDTWSCYKGGAVHCGACGTCFERREAFTLAGIEDPTEYEATPEYAAP